MRVHELAKDLGVTSKEVLAKLKALKIAAKSHASALDEHAISAVRQQFSAAATPAKRAATGTKTRIATTPKAAVVAPPKPVARVKPAAKLAVATTAAARVAVPPSPPRAKPIAPVSPAAPARPTPVTKPTPAAVATLPEAPAAAPAAPEPPRPIDVKCPVTVKDLAAKLGVPGNEVIKFLMQQRVFASIVQRLDEPTAIKVARAFNCELLPQPTVEEQLVKSCEPQPARMVTRAPVVTFMGHVDHGKTSLLDAIRQAKVAEKEAGGITQHIGAYEVVLEKGHVTFLDTPGHEAFTALRVRGANATDIIVLVVAADDGVMPQTVEAINHAKAADVPLVVAINKVDLPGANLQKVKQQLSEHGLIAEDWGGKTIMVSVSAKTREGLDTLLEMLLLEAELLELRADPAAPAQGLVIEAKKMKDRGAVATFLVQHGTLRVGDPVLAGSLVGRVRALIDDRGHRVKDAGPAKPVEVLGLPDAPQAGDRFLVVDDERLARSIAEQRQDRGAQLGSAHPHRVTLEELHQRITQGELKELRLILKGDVRGSLEAIRQSIQKLDADHPEVQIKLLHEGVGDINESDVILAAASDALVLGFHVGIDPQVQVLAVKEGVDVHIYPIIYEVVSALKAAIEGLLGPKLEENFVGRAEIRRLFQVSKAGLVAGCMVVKGSVRRDCTARVIRGKARVFEGNIASLKRIKDDAREIQEGNECGIALAGNVDLQVGDLIEAWEIKEVERKLA